MEYFAETTEAFFGRNDFFPFTRGELKTHDPDMFELLGKLWRVEAGPAPAAAPVPPPLTQQLLNESPAELAKAARARGDAGRGAVLFFQPFLTCAKCHDGEAGPHLGPDVAKAGREATAEHLIESVLLPSKQIKKGYEPLTVSTADGRTVTGLLAEETNAALTLLDPAGGKRVVIAKADIDQRATGTQSLMPAGLANLLSDRQQFLDLAKYLIEVAEGGPKRAKELRPAQTAFVLPEYEKDLDHAGLIRKLDQKAFQRGEAIYTRVCANCHGTKDQPGSLPTSPKFAAHTFKNGSDPHSLYRTLTHGYERHGPTDLDGAAAEVRRDPLPPRGVPEAAQPDAVHQRPMRRIWPALPKGKKLRPGPVKRRAVDGDGLRPEPDEHLRGGRAGAEHRVQGHRRAAGCRAGGVSRGKSWALFDHDTLRSPPAGPARGSSTGRASTSTASTRFTRS